MHECAHTTKRYTRAAQTPVLQCGTAYGRHSDWPQLRSSMGALWPCTLQQSGTCARDPHLYCSAARHGRMGPPHLRNSMGALWPCTSTTDRGLQRRTASSRPRASACALKASILMRQRTWCGWRGGAGAHAGAEGGGGGRAGEGARVWGGRAWFSSLTLTGQHLDPGVAPGAGGMHAGGGVGTKG